VTTPSQKAIITISRSWMQVRQCCREKNSWNPDRNEGQHVCSALPWLVTLVLRCWTWRNSQYKRILRTKLYSYFSVANRFLVILIVWLTSCEFSTR
jgi:hypothetical protein